MLVGELEQSLMTELKDVDRFDFEVALDMLNLCTTIGGDQKEGEIWCATNSRLLTRLFGYAWHEKFPTSPILITSD